MGSVTPQPQAPDFAALAAAAAAPATGGPFWWEKRMCAIDLETTSADPQTCEIVTAAVVFVGDRKPTDGRVWLADPGIEIPDEAAAIHGVTTEKARAEGLPLEQVLSEVSAVLCWGIAQGLPVVGYNIGRFDLTVIARSCERLGVPVPWVSAGPMRVVDPRPLDMFLDRFRPSYPYSYKRRDGTYDMEAIEAAGIPSSRTLEGMCEVYDAILEGAHDATYDAVAAARLAYRIGQRGIVKRRTRNPQEEAELYELRERWGLVRNDLDALQDLQREVIEADRPRFAEYKRTEAARLAAAGEEEAAQAALDMAEHVLSERGWPVLDPVAS